MNEANVKNISKFIHSLEQDEKNFLLTLSMVASANLFECLATDYKDIFLDVINNYQTIFFHSVGTKCALDNDYDRFLNLILQMKEYAVKNGMDRH